MKFMSYSSYPFKCVSMTTYSVFSFINQGILLHTLNLLSPIYEWQTTSKNCSINLISSLKTKKYEDQKCREGKSKLFHLNLKDSIIFKLENSNCIQISNFQIY